MSDKSEVTQGDGRRVTRLLDGIARLTSVWPVDKQLGSDSIRAEDLVRLLFEFFMPGENYDPESAREWLRVQYASGEHSVRLRLQVDILWSEVRAHALWAMGMDRNRLESVLGLKDRSDGEIAAARGAISEFVGLCDDIYREGTTRHGSLPIDLDKIIQNHHRHAAGSIRAAREIFRRNRPIPRWPYTPWDQFPEIIPSVPSGEDVGDYDDAVLSRLQAEVRTHLWLESAPQEGPDLLVQSLGQAILAGIRSRGKGFQDMGGLRGEELKKWFADLARKAGDEDPARVRARACGHVARFQWIFEASDQETASVLGVPFRTLLAWRDGSAPSEAEISAIDALDQITSELLTAFRGDAPAAVHWMRETRPLGLFTDETPMTFLLRTAYLEPVLDLVRGFNHFHEEWPGRR